MKPNFALCLSFDQIRLLHRGVAGWHLVGDVPTGAPDLASGLTMIRKTATALSPDGMRCKVVIPDDQIRYLRLSTPQMDMGERRDAARNALIGATPYAIDELAFDVAARGDETDVAAVALETLREAEAFASEHLFYPVSLVASPDLNTYAGEPYFGPSQSARDLLEPGQTVEPDTQAISMPGSEADHQSPVVQVTEDIAVVNLAPTTAQTETPTFKSGRTPLKRAKGARRKAIASLMAAKPNLAGVTDPDVPQREVRRHLAAFSSRRSPDPKVYNVPPLADRPKHGFAEQADTFEHGSKARKPAIPDPRSEADRMTVFGARRAHEADKTGYRLPIAFSAGLIVTLVGVGALSSSAVRQSIAAWTGATSAVPATITAIDVSPPVAQVLTEEPADSPASLTAELSDEDAAVLDALRTPAPERRAPSRASDDLRASYAVTGIWPKAPAVPMPGPLVDIEDLYVSVIDPVEPAFATLAPQKLASFSPDPVFNAPASPAAAGTKFAFDDRGLVVPSSQGTLTPQGIKVFSGEPPIKPAVFPPRNVTKIALSPIQTEFSEFRPEARPASLVEVAEPEKREELIPDELSEVRPPVRPVPDSATRASLAQVDDVAPKIIETSNSRLALAATLRPDARPSNFNQIVARAQRTAGSAAVVSTAAVTPAPRSIAPSIPSSTSVTREATLRNAINLRQVNLIGVYGTPSARRALVRLANGRYKKVQVGDRIDGGQVSAIGEGELRYQRRGKNIVLKMPSS